MNTKRIIFILPTTVGSLGAPTAPSPGIAYLAAALLEQNHEVRVCDLRVEKKKALHSQISDFKPDFLGISFMSFGYLEVYSLIGELKERYPAIPIIIGGPHPSLFPHKVMEECRADFLIFREGEDTVCELLADSELKTIKGLVWRDGAKIIVNPQREFITELDKIPFARYDLFPLGKYIDKKIPIVSSRGCPYNCIFCSIKPTMGSQWRSRTPENVVAEIEHWYDKGYDYFHFIDDNVAQDADRFIAICDLIVANGLKIRWDLRNGIRVNRVNYDLLMKMKAAGCFYLVLSVESFDDEMLKKMKKGLNLEIIEKAISDTKRSGIPFGVTVLIGLPGDTFATFLKNYEMVKKHNFEEVRFYNAKPYPKTELAQMIAENGSYLVPPEVYLNYSTVFDNKPLFDYPGFSVSERKRALAMAENLVMEKLIKKEFGSFLGSIGYNLWRIKVIRIPVMRAGIALWGFLRKLR